MPFQLNCGARPPEHPGYHGVRSLAEKLNLAPCPTASLWSKDRDAQRFTFPCYRGRAASHQFCQFFVSNSPKQAQFVVGPSFPMLNAGPSAAIQIQQPVGLAQEPRYLPVRLGMDQLPNCQPLSCRQFILCHESLNAKSQGVLQSGIQPSGSLRLLMME